jgi:hypothetical protein
MGVSPGGIVGSRRGSHRQHSQPIPAARSQQVVEQARADPHYRAYVATAMQDMPAHQNHRPRQGTYSNAETLSPVSMRFDRRKCRTQVSEEKGVGITMSLVDRSSNHLRTCGSRLRAKTLFRIHSMRFQVPRACSSSADGALRP